ncbi:MAG: NADPH-dependent F420 reductase [Terriglobia bacterium]
MKIGIIGTGRVGAALGQGLAAKGHEVRFGAREPDGREVKQVVTGIGHGVSALNISDCARSSDVIFLAVPWDAALGVVRSLGDLAGKVLVDCTNPLRDDLEGLQIGTTTSAAEEIARVAGSAKVVKCFNTTGAKNIAQTNYHGQAIDAYICADDENAKQTVAALARELGFEVVDCGPLRSARWTEGLAMLWIYLCVKRQSGPDVAFKLLRL